jgi:hypothetical protein
MTKRKDLSNRLQRASVLAILGIAAFSPPAVAEQPASTPPLGWSGNVGIGVGNRPTYEGSPNFANT